MTAHLHLPASMIEEVADHLHRPGCRSASTHLNALAIGDAPTAVLVRTLSEGLASGATELFAETILIQLAQRLLDPERPGDREPFYDPRRMRDAERRLRRAVEFTSADLAAQHSLDTIAREAGISKFHFARLFREALVCAPYGFMTALRLDTAKQMLATSDLPISTIAVMVGYPVARNFTVAFRRRHKQRPDAVERTTWR